MYKSKYAIIKDLKQHNNSMPMMILYHHCIPRGLFNIFYWLRLWQLGHPTLSRSVRNCNLGKLGNLGSAVKSIFQATFSPPWEQCLLYRWIVFTMNVCLTINLQGKGLPQKNNDFADIVPLMGFHNFNCWNMVFWKKGNMIFRFS